MSDSPADVTVSIVNWNTREELQGCIASVVAQKDVILEINVVDNASEDGSREMVESEFSSQVHLIANESNAGFGAGHNKSIERSGGRYVILLNPDCRFLSDDVLSGMTQFMDVNPDVGMIGPRIVNPDGSIQFSARRFPSVLAGMFRHTIFGKLFPKNRFEREYLMTDWAHDRVTDVDWLSGSALMVRRETFRQIGTLDERFFMYVEDMDWCRRAHEGGWRVVYYPMVSVSHRIGAASDLNQKAMVRQHHKSMLLYFLKYNSRNPRILLTPLVMLGLWLRMRARIKLTRR